MTRQEMFDLAYRGLASQGWLKCYDDTGCVYQHVDGRRCAWGWVDRSLGSEDIGAVDTLHKLGRGLAANVSSEDMQFVLDLQIAHDSADFNDPQDLHRSMLRLADRYDLTIPELL